MLAGQAVTAPPALACHGMSTEEATLVPGGFTFEARATTSANGNTGWTYAIDSSTPAGLTPTVTWSRIDAYPNGDVVGGPDPTSHAAGEGMRFFVSGLSAGDQVTIRVIAFTGTNSDCTGAMTSQLSRSVTGSVAEDAPPPPEPPVETPAPPPVMLTCDPDPVAAGGTLTCTLINGVPGVDVLWRASIDGSVLEGVVVADEDGTGRFTFAVPRGGGGTLAVELVAWIAPVEVAVSPAAAPPLPTAIRAGEGPRPLLLVALDSLIIALIVVGMLLKSTGIPSPVRSVRHGAAHPASTVGSRSPGGRELPGFDALGARMEAQGDRIRPPLLG